MNHSSNANELLRIGGELEREGHFAEAWKLLCVGGEKKMPPTLPLWAGPGSQCNRLLIRRRIRHLGAELRNARFASLAAKHVPQVIVATERRLMPLLARSFPEINYVDASDAQVFEEADCETSYEGLASFFGSTDRDIEASFRPLVPSASPADPNGLGIAWHSVNQRKELPELDDWARVIGNISRRIQSLQYDEEDAGLVTLEEIAGRRIDRSPIDQKIDVDGFSGLVSSVESVLTISNTTAHMAGALGKPCVVLLDDRDHLTWPSGKDRTPFYPRLRFVRRAGRPWANVIRQGLVTLAALQ